MVLSIIEPALPAETRVVVAWPFLSWKLPMRMPQVSSPASQLTVSSCLTSLIALRNGWIFAPPGRVLNFSASVAIVTSSPPAALERSEMTGIGVKIVSMIGCNGLLASTICCR